MTYEAKPGMSLDMLDTPALLVDLDALERNIERMARFFSGRPTGLRPHAKTHKSPEVAKRQIASGAVGITCAKVSEAEVLAEAGVSDILIANQIVGPLKIERLMDVASSAAVMVAVDDAANVSDLSAACQASGTSLGVLVEVDVGMKRCGVRPGEPAVDLARAVADAPGLVFKGLQGYEGHAVQIIDDDLRAATAREAVSHLANTCEALEEAGLPAEIVSGGGTGTYDTTGTTPPMTDVQAGSYVFMDTKYLGVRPEFEPALFILSTVLSRPTPERVIIDAGMKTMTKEFGWPKPLDAPGVVVTSLSEEHGKLEIDPTSDLSLRPGDRLRLVPSHCCTTVNLHDWYYVVRDDTLIDIWPVAARGCFQ